MKEFSTGLHNDADVPYPGLRIIVLGAGAVGCYYGGLLALANHDVTLVGRAPHVEAINANGLAFEAWNFKGNISLRATSDAQTLEAPDLVLVCVKSADTDAAASTLASTLGPATEIISLQNGVDNAERLSAALHRQVIPAVVYVGVEMIAPGKLRHHGRGELLIGPSASSKKLAQILSDALIPTTISDEIRMAQWTKLTANCAWNALSAVGNAPYGDILDLSGAQELIVAIVDECRRVANASGVDLPHDTVSKVLEIGRTMPGQISSTAQDLNRGKRTEIDFLNGFIAKRGSEYGIPTPANLALQVMVKLAESRGT